MSTLHRLVYTSVRTPKCDEAALQDILASCEKNNPAREVTGILVHSDRRFLQYIEGNKEELLSLFNLIKNDHRHTAVNQRDFQPIEKRIFPSWHMGYRDLTKAVQFKTEISEEHKKTFDALIHGEMDFSNHGLKILQLFFNL